MIINMWWFYLIDVLDTIKNVSFVTIAVLGVGVFLYLIISYLEEIEINKKILNLLIIILTFSIVSSFLIPSRQTMYTMMISSVATYDNVDSVFEVIQDSVDYIFEKLD